MAGRILICVVVWLITIGLNSRPTQAVPPTHLASVVVGAVGGEPNGVNFSFVRVPKGSFWMGGGTGKTGTKQVEIKDDFWIGAYEVTQGQWQALLGDNPSYFSRTGPGSAAVKRISDADLRHFPVEHVSWEDVQLFLKKLNTREQGTGWLYRLPTEEEWEYACRGAASSKEDCAFDYYFAKPTNELNFTQANYERQFQRPCRVGSYAPNALGLYDMHGNVWEWTDSLAEAGSMNRVRRGGCFFVVSTSCRAAFRFGEEPTKRNNNLGFRLVRVPVPPSK